MEGIQVFLVLLFEAIVTVEAQGFFRRRMMGFPLPGGFRGPILPPGPMPYSREHWFRFGSRGGGFGIGANAAGTAPGGGGFGAGSGVAIGGRMLGLPFPRKRWLGPQPGHFRRPIIANPVGPGMAGGRSSSFGYRKGGDTTLYMKGPRITINTESRDRGQGFIAGAGAGVNMGGQRFIGADAAGAGVGMGGLGIGIGARAAGTGFGMGVRGLSVGAGAAGAGIGVVDPGFGIGAGGIGTGTGIVNPGFGVGISTGGAGIGIAGVNTGAGGAGIIMGPGFASGGPGVGIRGTGVRLGANTGGVGIGMGGSRVGVGAGSIGVSLPRYTLGYGQTQGQQIYTHGDFNNNNPYRSGQSLMQNPGLQNGFSQVELYDASPITGRKQDQVSVITAQSSRSLDVPSAQPVPNDTKGGYVLDIIPIGQQLKQDTAAQPATKNVH